MKQVSIRGAKYLVLSALLALSPAALAAPASIAWVDYMGAQDGDVQWAHMIRGFQRGNTGMDRINSQGQQQSRPMPLRPGTHTVIIPIGALPKPGEPQAVQAYFRMVESDQGKAWQSLLVNQARTISSQLPGHEIYWQVGNEINSRNYGLNVGGYGGGRAFNSPNQPEVISVYAEKILAPAAAALQGSTRSGAPGSKIIIGTLANAFNRVSQQWLLNFLDYQIQGTIVPSLRGRRVSSLGDVVGIHYLLSREGEEWLADMDRLYSEVVRVRHMQGLWLTEEIGKDYPNRGLGGATAIKVWARFMSWVSVNNLNPEQARLNFWGWQLGSAGSSGGDAMDYLFAQIGTSPISVIGAREFSEAPFGELYAFKINTGGSLLIAVADGRSGGNRDIAIPAGASGKQAACRIFGAGSARSVPCTIAGGKLHSDALGDLEENGALVAVLK